MNFCGESDTFRPYGVEAYLFFIMVFTKERPLVFVYNRRRSVAIRCRLSACSVETQNAQTLDPSYFCTVNTLHCTLLIDN